MSLKGSGEALAQLIAEKANPKTDVWFGGTGDPHLQAAEQGLTLEYKSPDAAAAARLGAAAGAAVELPTVGIYSGPLGFGYNTELLAKKKLPCRRPGPTCSSPSYKGEIQVANPASSGTAYTMIATLVQLMGEDKAFDYMKGLHKNIGQYTALGHRRRSRPWRAARRRCRSASCTTAPARRCRASRWRPITPADGTGAEIGSMSIIKGARNLDAAKKFYEWALTPQAQQFGAAAKQFQLPSNKAAPRSTRACPTSRRSSSSTTTTPSTAPAPSGAA